MDNSQKKIKKILWVKYLGEINIDMKYFPCDIFGISNPHNVSKGHNTLCAFGSGVKYARSKSPMQCFQIKN